MRKTLILIFFFFLVINSISFSVTSYDYYETNNSDFKLDYFEDKTIQIQGKIIGGVSVDYYKHYVNGFEIKNDYILVQKNPDSNDVVLFENEWRCVGSSIISFVFSDLEFENIFWKNRIVFLQEEDLGIFYTITEDTTYPLACWEVRHIDGSTILYDSNGGIIGYGIPTPANGYSLSGMAEWQGPDPDFDAWAPLRENAHGWFKKWTSRAVTHGIPDHWQVSFRLSDSDVDYFYEIAHSPAVNPLNPTDCSKRFLLSWSGDDSWFIASDVEEALSDRGPMKFAFIGSCEGLSHTGPGTLSYAFRKGENKNTAVVGFSHMSSSPGWSDVMSWQDFMFENMDEGKTVKESFDLACAQYPAISDNVKFDGDTNVKSDESETTQKTSFSHLFRLSKILGFLLDFLKIGYTIR